MRLILPVLFLMFLPHAVWAQQTLTLQDAIRISLENNFQLKQAENNLSLSGMEVTSAYAEFLPNLSASFGGNQNVGRQFIQEDLTFEDRTTYGMSGGLQASVTIFSGFENINNLRRSRVVQTQQVADTDRIRENIIFDTAMRYLQVLLDIELLDIAEQNLETSQVQLNQVEAQVEVGSRPVVDLYQQQSTVASNEVQVVQAENSVNISRTRLIRMLQVDPLQDIEFSIPDFDESDLAPRDLDLEEMIQLALSNRKDMEAMELEILASRYDLDIARANKYPRVTASANLSSRYSDQYQIVDPATNQPIRATFGDQFFEQMIQRSAGFSISIPIFNRWNTNVSIQQARIQHRNARLSLDDIRYGIREEISQAYNDYSSLVKELEATERSLQAAERAYETQQQRYDIGAASLIELNQATTDYMEAMSSRQQVIYNFVFQEKLLDYYIGRITDDVSL
ncbi:MAG: TolC family protein [Balneolaceae bacterium]